MRERRSWLLQMSSSEFVFLNINLKKKVNTLEACNNFMKVDLHVEIHFACIVVGNEKGLLKAVLMNELVKEWGSSITWLWL